MHAAGKVILGLIIIAIGLTLLSNGVLFTIEEIGTFWLSSFLTVLAGVIPPFLILIGLFVVWLELDEIKAEKELKAEEKKMKNNKNGKK